MVSSFLPRTAQRNPFLEQLLREGASTTPISSPYQGLSRLAFALLAGLEARNRDSRPLPLAWPTQPAANGPLLTSTGSDHAAGAIPYLREQGALPFGQFRRPPGNGD